MLMPLTATMTTTTSTASIAIAQTALITEFPMAVQQLRHRQCPCHRSQERRRSQRKPEPLRLQQRRLRLLLLQLRLQPRFAINNDLTYDFVLFAILLFSTHSSSQTQQSEEAEVIKQLLEGHSAMCMKLRTRLMSIKVNSVFPLRVVFICCVPFAMNSPLYATGR